MPQNSHSIVELHTTPFFLNAHLHFGNPYGPPENFAGPLSTLILGLSDILMCCQGIFDHWCPHVNLYYPLTHGAMLKSLPTVGLPGHKK